MTLITRSHIISNNAPFISATHENKQNSSHLSVTTNSYPCFSNFALELHSRLLELKTHNLVLTAGLLRTPGTKILFPYLERSQERGERKLRESKDGRQLS